MAHPASWSWLPSRVCRAVATQRWWRCGQWWWRRRACPGDRAGVPERDRRHLAQRLKRARLGRPQYVLHPWTGAPRSSEANFAPLLVDVLELAKQIHEQPACSCAHHGPDNKGRYVHNTPPSKNFLDVFFPCAGIFNPRTGAKRGSFKSLYVGFREDPFSETR